MCSVNWAYCRLGREVSAGVTGALTVASLCDCSVVFPVGGSRRQRDEAGSRRLYPEGEGSEGEDFFPEEIFQEHAGGVFGWQ